jgi:hypothetical protein
VLFGDDSGNATECAEDAGASGKPYRLAIEFEGPTGTAWQGAARDERGRLWAVYFDTDPSAKPGTGDTLSVVPCSSIRFADKGDDVILCQPMTRRALGPASAQRSNSDRGRTRLCLRTYPD